MKVILPASRFRLKPRIALAISMSLLLLVATPTRTLAHAILVESAPKQDEVLATGPKEVVLRFNARIEKKVARATLTDGSGKKIKLPPIPEDKAGPPDRLVIPLPALKAGSYRLEYKVLAADGHATPGLLRFKVQEDVKPPQDGAPEGGTK